MTLERLIPLSDAQCKVLQVFRDSETKPKWIAPITRRWLVRHGLITATSQPRGKFVFEITDSGRELLRLDEAYKSAIKLKAGDPR